MTYLTPAEAKEQTCPLIKYCVNPVAVQNDSQSAMHDHIACMGPGCKIGWRWGDKPRDCFMVTFDGKPEVEWSWDPTGAPGYEAAVVRVVTSDRRGFCGHFGRPE